MAEQGVSAGRALRTAMPVVHCPACGPGPTSVWLDRGQTSRYIRCEACDTIYLSPHPNESSVTVAASAPAADEQITAKRVPALESISRNLRSRLSGGRLLDIGCSSGDFFHYFNRENWERHGVEPHPGTAYCAEQRHGIPVYCGLLRAASFPPSYFDLITLIDTIYHLPDPLADFSEIHRILQPQGIFAIELAGAAYSRLRNRGPLCWVIDRRWTRLQTDGNHLYWHSLAGLEQLLAISGFVILECDLIQSPLRQGFSGAIAKCYNSVMSVLCKKWPKLLSWGPKYLCIAGKKPSEEESK